MTCLRLTVPVRMGAPKQRARVEQLLSDRVMCLGAAGRLAQMEQSDPLGSLLGDMRLAWCMRDPCHHAAHHPLRKPAPRPHDIPAQGLLSSERSNVWVCCSWHAAGRPGSGPALGIISTIRQDPTAMR